MIIVSSTKQYLKIFIVYPDMHHLNAAPCLAYCRQLRKGLITIGNISGDDQFSCPSPCGVVFSVNVHLSPPKLDIESPNSVLTE